MRDVDARLDWFLANRPAAAGRCAEHVMRALDVPRQGLPSASAVARLVMQDRRMQQGPCPRGAIRYWTGGAEGHGHVGIEYAPLNQPAAVASTDVGGPRTMGVRDLSWFARNWPALKYAGWSWWWGAINTEPQPADENDPWMWFSGKPKGTQVVPPDGKWHHLTGLDEPASGIVGGSEHRLLYLRLELTPGRTATRVLETKFVRANGDATAYDSEEFGTTLNSYPYQNQHMEEGDGAGGKWFVKVTGGKDPVTLTTRYAKQHTVQ